MRGLAWFGCVALLACGSSSSKTPDGGGSGGSGSHCNTGDACDVITDSGCGDDQRCDVAQISATCFEPMCVEAGTMQLGDPCSNTNSEGSVTWDNCFVGSICYMSACRAPCDPGGGGAGCGSAAHCVADGDVGMLTIGVCLPN
ncbi:MAG TPA: hypothetical protein VGF94_09895 [Kofleriaceae bacterium]